MRAAMTFPNAGDEFHDASVTSGQPAADEPAVPPSGQSGGLPKLGSLTSLAQTARMKHIKSAKTVLYVVGILTMGVSAVMLTIADQSVQSQIDRELRKLGPDFVVDDAKMAEGKGEAVAATRFGAGLSFMEGVVFLLLGMFVQKAPVAMTATGLILYIADYAIGAALDPAYLVQGIIVKIVVVVCLVKALQAAIAYERERETAGMAV
jgi:hypothetical protein